ncbi:MAG: glutamate--tRNA ligase [Erysipelotrichales bacterium]|nr:glutamate--tRNA ligase [Erysipelotrichales bacterium]
MDKKVRVRYAPSPTGFLHIGGARSALFNYLYAKRNNGDFVFRIEDTDIERNVKGGEESQLNDLVWLGIVPDESPLNPNPKFAPYRQMERLDMYHKYAKWLIDQGYAYECYCTEEELDASREEQYARGINAPKYDRHCVHLSEEEKEKYRKEGRKPCIRLKLEDHLTISFDDMIRGKVTFNNDDIGDWVIMKSNGIPTYNFAVVIDDHMMEITHVLRGEEHLSNTPKQIQLYKYFGWEVPTFGHMTIIVNENGKKLSKRDNNILQFMSQYRELGYLPEAIFNFILLLGWTPNEEREMFTLDEAKQIFDPSRMSASPSMFDQHKLNWMNAQYIRKLNDEDYLVFIKPYLAKVVDVNNYSDEQLLFMANMFKNEILYGAQIVDLLKPLFDYHLEENEEIKEILNLDSTPIVLKSFEKHLSDAQNLEVDTMKQLFKDVGAETGVKGKLLYMPIRLMITGQMHGAELVNIIKLLGKEEILRRLNK